ncbi:BnaA09g46100D [Brassica napus]|uniref:BnaA09g46100D protein n=1 Tax=Brassica napus TaxID=3708 RepID=A0A078H8J3_BRANA|nr:BnaA09g46100D [Brassica napus]
MKKVFLNIVLLSILLGAAFHLANGAEVNHQAQCDSDLECYTMRSCLTGPGYCDNGVCKCPKLQVVDTNGAVVNHLGQCDTDLECYTMHCDRGDGYCDHSNVDGVCKSCKCPKLQAAETKKHTNGVDLNHLGQCDTDLECYTMPSCNRGNGYCDQKDGKCKCPK